MNDKEISREEAKALLELVRPNHSEDLEDPDLLAAFERLENDSELQEWFEATQQTDAAITASLQSIRVPQGLEAAILTSIAEANHADTEAASTEASTEAPISFSTAKAEETPKATQSGRRFWWAGPAAGIAAVFAIAFLFFGTPKASAEGSQVADRDLPDILAFLSEEIDGVKPWSFGKRSEDPRVLQAYLNTQSAPSPDIVPPHLENLPAIGCITFQYQDSVTLSMICFKDDAVYHLITADRASYPGEVGEKPRLYQCANKAYKVWAQGDDVKIVSMKGSKRDLPDFI